MRITTTGASGTEYFIGDLFDDCKMDYYDLEDICVEYKDNPPKLAEKLNSLNGMYVKNFVVERIRDKYIRLKGTDVFNNRRFLIIEY